MMERTEIIYTAGHIEEAVLLKQILADRDIDAQIENEVLQGSIGGLPPGEATNPRVRVAAEDAPKAREVVKSFEYQQRMARQQWDIEYISPTPEAWIDWPTCPECGRRRQTVCPICETAGSDLPLADANHAGTAPQLGKSKTGDEQDRPLLICTTCDEPFQPQFYQLCAWCGHDFQNGIAPPPPQQAAERLSPQAWAVIIGLGGLLIALGGYFWWLTQS